MMITDQENINIVDRITSLDLFLKLILLNWMIVTRMRNKGNYPVLGEFILRHI